MKWVAFYLTLKKKKDFTPPWPARHQAPTPQHIPYPKLDFPQFSGEYLQGWLENCEQYFDLYQIPKHRWLSVATMHIAGKVWVWKQGYFITSPGVSWEEFSKTVCKRFEDVGECYLVREFSNHKKIGSIDNNHEKFEELRSQILHHNQHLDWKEELVPIMDMLRPANLEDAYGHANLHDWAISVMQRRVDQLVKGQEEDIKYSLTTGDRSTNHLLATESKHGPSSWPTGGSNQSFHEHKRLMKQRGVAG